MDEQRRQQQDIVERAAAASSPSCRTGVLFNVASLSGEGRLNVIPRATPVSCAASFQTPPYRGRQTCGHCGKSFGKIYDLLSDAFDERDVSIVIDRLSHPGTGLGSCVAIPALTMFC